MLTPAVLLVALAGCSGSGGHRTVSSTSSTTASTISGTSTASSSKATPAAACTSNAIQPVLDRSVPTAAGVRIVGVEVRECRNGYARVMAIVDLQEGPRAMTNIVDCEFDDLQIGMPLEVAFRQISEEYTLPVFKPAA